MRPSENEARGQQCVFATPVLCLILPECFRMFTACLQVASLACHLQVDEHTLQAVVRHASDFRRTCKLL